MKKLILLSAIILIASCQTTIPQVVQLPLPPPLELPVLAGGLECLPNAAYEILVKRDLLQTERRKTLRSIIETTH